ncbi:hypothetical protein BGW36DRAFT_395099 [Talaromyces proteolyticus]|uniref:Integral membrane protein n=1 Tax=Talaromyces proteolyticus TaxID=1131652 RepID=A0AAD4L249_9EURO|nr:uncharacterized protein BGW36DRAFT_395099 [Talaromyces proteolyticus]KAH8702465.1 hypothetical protein BGW36DRAFT_395099 [Talaromyces proteolyticus]
MSEDSQPVAARSPHPSQRRSRQPSIRLRRLSSASSFDQQAAIENRRSATPQSIPDADNIQNADDDDAWQAGRRRSNSEPRPGRYSAPPIVTSSATSAVNSRQHMSPVKEETASMFRPSLDFNTAEALAARPRASEPAPEETSVPTQELHSIPSRTRMLRRASNVALSALGRNRASTVSGPEPTQRSLARDEYDSRIVDLLDVIDPEVSTLSTLTNVQNSLFIPDLGNLLNRMPTYNLTRRPTDISEGRTSDQTTEDEGAGIEYAEASEERPRPLSSMSIVLGRSHFAILPDGASLDGWSKQDIEELNDHVRHMLHSRRSKFKRAMRGFGQYVRKPLGFFVTLYATLITLFGLAWVLFLIGWINVGGRQLYIINVIDNVLVALFAVMGDGLAPFRAVDTYHMIFIAHYHHLTWKLRKKRTLPKLQDKNDLPLRRADEVDVEREGEEKVSGEYSVLTPLQQHRLDHHQKKFSRSHTFYKPHETPTHHAFPLRLLVAIVVLLDFHSIFQIALGTCTWAISYHVRPFALTTVILCCSITCNITGGVLISIGDRMSRKKDVVERMSRQGLTCEAMKKVEKRKRREEQHKAEENPPDVYPGT